MIGRHLWSWKALFYGALLPALGRLGPAAADRALAWLGRCSGHGPQCRELESRVAAARQALGATWDIPATCRAVAASRPRLLARDLLLENLDDEEVRSRFDVSGFEAVQQAIERGEGLILLGSHFGAHLAGLHWLDRQGLPFRMLVQRPRHVSARLQARFDADDPRFPQRDFTLKRGMAPREAARCVLLARDALRAGVCVYLNGDIPCSTPSSRPAALLGRRLTFLSVWADLSILAGGAVAAVFCSALPGGRFRLRLEPPRRLAAGDQAQAVARYFRFLEDQLRDDPLAAALHWCRPQVQAPCSTNGPPKQEPAGS